MKKELTQTELWHLSAEALHTQEYREKYSSALAFLVHDKKASILDTACGSGFPTEDLYKQGFRNIKASDADAVSVEKLTKTFNKLGIEIPVYQGKWQELASRINEKFDVVINSDNSFVYMDGWLGEKIAEGQEAAFNRMKIVLSNFKDLLKDGGVVIVGLGKHYLPNNDASFERKFDLKKDGEEYTITWSSILNWQTRVHDWTTIINSDHYQGSNLRRSYLLTKDELATLMKKVGFSRVHILEPDGARDNLIIGIK